MSFDPQALAAALDAAEAAHLGATMGTQILDHGARTARVVVLVHGLTASPRAWQAFARERHARGETVLSARLPRHGHADAMTETLAQLSAEELRSYARLMIDAAQQLGDEIVVVGHSLGGTVVLHSAQHDARIARAIAVAPFLGIARMPRRLRAIARAVLERIPNRFLYWDPIDRGRSLPPHGYPRYATRSIAAGLEIASALTADARAAGPLAAHVELLRNAGETTVDNRAIDELAAAWRAAGAHNVRLHAVMGLGRSHDVIEPERRGSRALQFLPLLHALLDAPPPGNDTALEGLTRTDR